MYIATTRFVDLEDDEHIYNIGDTYPRDGLTVSRERIIELITTKNKRNMPLITYVQGDVENDLVEEKKTVKKTTTRKKTAD